MSPNSSPRKGSLMTSGRSEEADTLARQVGNLAMMFSTKAEYGVRVMVELARRAGDDPIPLAEIAAHDGLPLALSRAPRREAAQGRAGGQPGADRAAATCSPGPPSEITMAEVVEALEGSIAPIECISEASDGSIVCARESTPRPRVPHQAAVDPGALLDRPAHCARRRSRTCCAARAARSVGPSSRPRGPPCPPSTSNP